MEKQSPWPSAVQSTAVDQGANGILLGKRDGVLNSSQIFMGIYHLRRQSYEKQYQFSKHWQKKLSKINFPTFNREQTQFQTFWQSFNCVVQSNKRISKIHKLNFLLNVLEGKAHRAVAGLELKELRQYHKNSEETIQK